jgi:hypothetical protein
MVALSQAFAAQAEVAGKGGGSISASMNEAVASLGIRTATIQLLRDGLYRACEAYRNGAINEFGYAMLLSNYDDVMIRLLAIEGLTSMHPAAQVAIGTQGDSSAKGSQSSKVTTAADNQSPGSKEVSSSDETKATGQATTTVLNQAAPAKFGAEEIKALAHPLEEFGKGPGPGGSTLAACMMWMSGRNFDQANSGHAFVKRACEAILDGRKRMFDVKPATMPATAGTSN